MKIEKFLDLNIGYLEKPGEINQADNLDLVLLEQNIPGLFWKANKIIWRLDINPQYPFGHLDRKKRKKLFHNAKQADKLGIKVVLENDLKQESFIKWFEIYQKQTEEKSLGRLAISQKWLAERQEKGEKVGGILVYQGDNMLGGLLFKKFLKKNRLSVSYRAYIRKNGLELGIGGLLEYYLLYFISGMGFKTITRGRDTNLYGHHLSPGLFHFKRSYGFFPWINPEFEDIEISSCAFISFDKFPHDNILFLTGEQLDLTLHIIYRDQLPDIKLYEAVSIKKVEIYTRREILDKHSQIIRSW